MTLTKDDITAMRRANRVSFHHREGKSSITAVKENRGSEVFQGGEATRSIDCRAQIQSSDRVDKVRCFETIHSAQSSEEWRTIAALLRPADEVELHWYRDAGTTQNLTERQLHADRLYLGVYRKGKKALSFFVEECVCPDNSARMIRA